MVTSFFAVALGEVGAILILFADFFGIDPLRIASEALKHPVSVFATAFFTIGFFAATLLIAERILYAKTRLPWVIALVVIALLTGMMRGMQAAALQETDLNLLFMTLLYTVIGVVFPLAAAFYAHKWREASNLTGLTESTERRLAEQEGRHTRRLNEANRRRTETLRELEQFTQEYVTHYQQALRKRESLKAAWEAHGRYVEAYLAELRLSYRFWEGWRSRGMTLPKPVKRLIQITAALLLAFIFSLLVIGGRIAHAEDGFNMMIVCDRSS